MAKSNPENSAGYVYYVDNPADFKARNHTVWERNSSFWLVGKMRHVPDLFDSVVLTLKRILRECPESPERIVVVDTGCGEGWAARALEDAGFDGKYVGLDFNSAFVEELRNRYSETERYTFRLHDLEEAAPKELQNTAHLVLNFFNLFELPSLDVAFSNLATLLRPNGLLLILHIDPITQLVAISNTLDQLRNHLRLYEQHRACLGYDKDIDVGDSRSGRYYRGLLYSVGDYFRCASAHGLVCDHIQEIVKTGSYVPQVYQMIEFRRPRGG